MNRPTYNTLSMAMLLAIAPLAQAQDTLSTQVTLPATKIALAAPAITPPTTNTSIATTMPAATPAVAAQASVSTKAPSVGAAVNAALASTTTPAKPMAAPSTMSPAATAQLTTTKTAAVATTVSAAGTPLTATASVAANTVLSPATDTLTADPSATDTTTATEVAVAPVVEPVLIALHATTAQIKAANLKIKKKSEKIALPKTNADATLDVTDIDQRIQALAVNAEHYPTNFNDKRERRAAEADIKDLTQTIDQYAVSPSASPEILLRAVKINQMSRNMDVGTESALKAGVYMRRLIVLTPPDPEANYWYGVMLSEGGGVKEGIPYLNKAATKGFDHAYLSLAHAYLMLNKRPEAISALESYKNAAPDQQASTTVLLEDVRAGSKSSIW